MRFPSSLPLSVALLLAQVPLLAGEHWIDPVNGSDANSGDTPQAPWRTLTHALDVIGPALGPQVETFHLLAGTFDAANGESFPLDLRPALEIIGLRGAQQTYIVGEPDADVLRIPVSDGSVASATLLAGISVSAGATGIHAMASFPNMSLELRDVVLEGNEIGLAAESTPVEGIVLLQAENLELRDNGLGARLARDIDATLSDSVFASNSGGGLTIVGSGGPFGSWSNVVLRRVRIQDNGDFGIRSGATGSNARVNLTVEDSLITGNASHGVETLPSLGIHEAVVERSTIADNGASGLHLGGPDPMSSTDNILHGNGTDVGGDLGGLTSTNDCIGADPGFVDAPAGDYRLAYGSPCVDNALAEPGGVDLVLQTRDVDGDGDTQRAPDRGALELVTLSYTGSATVGGSVTFELFSQPGERSLVFFRRGLPSPTPFGTPFGDFYLSPNGLRRLGTIRHLPGPAPTMFVVPIPSNPLFSGQVFTFQAISSSPAAPAGGATTTVAILSVE